MRVQFSPNGIGLGHVGRCIPIAKRLEERGVKVLFSTYKEGFRYAQQEGFPVVKVSPIEFRVKFNGTVDFRQTVVDPGPFFSSYTLLKQLKTEIEIMKAFNPNVVVSDTRISPIIAGKMLGIPEVCLLNQFQIIIPRRKHFLRLARLADAGTLTLIGKIWTAGVRVLIPDFPPPYTLSAGNLRIPSSYQKKVELIGPLLSTRPDELPIREEVRKKLGLSTDKTVIFAPISGPAKERAYFTGILREIFKDFPDNYQIVISLGYPNKSSKYPVKDGNLTVFNWISNRFEYLKACDVVVSRAGHGTLTQSICYGKTLILIPTPGHTEQINNAKKAAEMGIAYVFEQENLTRRTLLRTIRKMLDLDQFLERAKRIQKDVLRLNGLETAVKTIMDVVE